VWREDQIQSLLSNEDAETLFLSGCSSNMGKFRPRFDRIVLLSAPVGTILARLQQRTTNMYGKTPEEAARVVGLIDAVEPLLRRMADIEISTDAPLDDVLAQLIRIAQSGKEPG
jgi:dephospho-CoA kinase